MYSHTSFVFNAAFHEEVEEKHKLTNMQKLKISISHPLLLLLQDKLVSDKKIQPLMKDGC